MTSTEDKILIKILQQEKRYGMKRLLAEFPTNIGHSYCVSVGSGKSMTPRNGQQTTWQWKKKILLNKNAV